MNEICNKSMNARFYNGSSAASNSFLQQMDEVITELEESFANVKKTKECFMKECSMADRQNMNQTATYSPIYATKPNSEEKAFLDYIASGDICSKAHLLSRDEISGGYLIPQGILGNITARLKDLCPMRSLAKVDTIRSESLELLVDKGATDAGWMLTDELEDGGMPDLVKIKISTHQLYSKPKASQKILDDAGDALEDWIVSKITQKIAALENYAFLHGDGNHQPNGILQYDVVPLGQGAWEKIEGVLTNQISRDDLLTLVSSVKPEYLSNATWFMSRCAFSEIQHIADTSGRFLWQPSLINGAPSCLLGYPIVVSDDLLGRKDECITERHSAQILFGDFLQAYQIVDRGDVSILRDPYSAKPYVEFYATKRVGGDVVDFDAIKALCVSTSA
ncbi:MAG: phage major capsid protein [Holosporales bacterium]|jgi:HK97 family phage major capsid protein|nr:phage major capsid protein [Holosporales bacterium]